MKSRIVFSRLSFVFLFIGCTSTILSDERIRSETAGILGVRPDELAISDRRTEMTNTYYKAASDSGANYACVINGGNLVTWGMVNPPTCKVMPHTSR